MWVLREQVQEVLAVYIRLAAFLAYRGGCSQKTMVGVLHMQWVSDTEREKLARRNPSVVLTIVQG
jgi:hypothetical protein